MEGGIIFRLGCDAIGMNETHAGEAGNSLQTLFHDISAGRLKIGRTECSEKNYLFVFKYPFIILHGI